MGGLELIIDVLEVGVDFFNLRIKTIDLFARRIGLSPYFITGIDKQYQNDD